MPNKETETTQRGAPIDVEKERLREACCILDEALYVAAGAFGILATEDEGPGYAERHVKYAMDALQMARALGTAGFATPLAPPSSGERPSTEKAGNSPAFIATEHSGGGLGVEAVTDEQLDAAYFAAVEESYARTGGNKWEADSWQTRRAHYAGLRAALECASSSGERRDEIQSIPSTCPDCDQPLMAEADPRCHCGEAGECECPCHHGKQSDTDTETAGCFADGSDCAWCMDRKLFRRSVIREIAEGMEVASSGERRDVPFPEVLDEYPLPEGERRDATDTLLAALATAREKWRGMAFNDGQFIIDVAQALNAFDAAKGGERTKATELPPHTPDYGAPGHPKHWCERCRLESEGERRDEVTDEDVRKAVNSLPAWMGSQRGAWDPIRRILEQFAASKGRTRDEASSESGETIVCLRRWDPVLQQTVFEPLPDARENAGATDARVREVQMRGHGLGGLVRTFVEETEGTTPTTTGRRDSSAENDSSQWRGGKVPE